MPLSRKNIPRYRYMFGQNDVKRPLGKESPHRSFLVDKVDGKKWSPERVAIHEKIRKDLEREFADIPKDKKAIFLSGEPGAGKSHFVQNTQGIVGNYAIIDIDSVRDRLLTELSNQNLLNLPEHPLTSPVTPRELATLYHAEARDIVKRIQKWAINSGRNVLIDEPMTAISSLETVQGIRKRGYDTTGVQFRCSPETAKQAIKDRYIEGANHHPLGGRLVPQDVTSDARKLAPINFERIREAGLFDRSFDSFRDGAEPRIVSSWTGLKKDATPAKISELKFGSAAHKKAVGKPRVGIGSRPGETVSRRKVVSGDEIPQYKKAKQASLQVNQSSKNIEQGVEANRVPSPGERSLTRSMASKKVPTGTPVKKKITTPQPEDLRFRAPTDIKREPKIPRPGASSAKKLEAAASTTAEGVVKQKGKVKPSILSGIRKPRGSARANIPRKRTSSSGVRDTRTKVASPSRVQEKVVDKKVDSPVKKTTAKKGIGVLKPGSRPVAKKTGAALGQTKPVSKAVAKPIDGSKQQTTGPARPVPTVKKATAVQKSLAQQPQPTVRMLPNAPARAIPTPRGTTKRGIRKTTLPPSVQTNPQQRRPQPTVTNNSQNKKPPINGERNSFVPNSNVPAPVRQTPGQTTTKKVRSRKIKALNMIGKSRPVVQGQNGNIQTVKKQVRAKTNQPKPSVKKQIIQKAVGKKSPPKPTNNVPQTTRVQSRKNVAAPQPTVKKASLLATKKAPTPKPTAVPQPTVKPKPIVAPIPPAKKPIQPPQPPRPGGR